MKKLILNLFLGVMLIGMMGFVVAETTCEDSDDLDYSSAGETVVVTNDSLTLTISDGCLSDITSLLENDTIGIVQTLIDNMIAEVTITNDMITNNKILLESRCPSPLPETIENPLIFQISYECPNGCSAGACLSETENETEENETEDQEKFGIGQIIRRRVKAGVYTNEDGDQIRVRELAQGRFEFRFKEHSAETELEMEEETEDGKTKFKVKLKNGRNAIIKIMPDAASAIALKRLRLRVCNATAGCTIEFKEVGKGNKTKLVYEVRAKKTFRIFGFIKNREEIRTQIDAETGEVIETRRPWWAWLASEKEE